MRDAVLIYNPKSGRQVARRLLPAVLERLRAGGFEVEPLATTGPRDATRLARDAAKSGAEVVFAMGGDGTLREVAEGLLGSESVLGPLPAGTANVLRRALGLPGTALEVAELLTRCEAREIDVGTVNAGTVNAGTVDGEPFLMMASCGLDAAVMAHQNAGLKKLFGPAALGFAILRRWWNYAYPEIELVAEGERLHASLVVVSNIPFYGGDFRIAPSADFRDGKLDLVAFHGRGRRATLSFGRDLALGRHLERPDVTLLQVEEVEILGPPGIPFQADGDVLALAPPVTVSLAAHRLRVLLPSGV